MTRLGILTMIPFESNSYFDEMAKRAKEYQIVLFLFSPLSIKPATEMVEGLRYDTVSDKWEVDQFTIPEYLYDRCFYGEDRKSAEARSIVSWLKSNKNIQFLGYGLPNKWRLYETLKDVPAISPYLPKTKKASSPEKILEELKKHDEIIIKPIDGAHGFAVYSIQEINKKIKIRTTKQGNVIEKLFDNVSSVTSWLENLLSKQIFLIQPRLNNFNSMNEPYDLRVFLQKNEEGKWEEKAKAIRAGKKHGLLTNISAGAKVYSFQNLKDITPHLNHNYIQQELNDILKTLPEILEDKFHPLFELGIDIIIAKDQSLWILDMNSKTGRKIVKMTEPDKLESLYSAPLAYCSYLASQNKNVLSNQN
ncbi:YheC/YheD family protein [Heyndrickxia sporothermodurans]|uniref:YheC/YheD family protein n=1 Tax=Heyndrickxia sporothermodurans TaxID=46224 RepID=A0AB37HL42_9BACI|nr:YheC/YheD family protein [Heyndrickxia sporothermodurans]MBL5767582.1 YheC/YheD family protein [Heyndrickxia sporothermodurans]MBL5770562.1 YheC/YheD family protein [Heyndrickxia sporothermodurans]MBL5774251.1 YheC/YheD family protein [Heyndrickxia sporothermodurans]MBL5777697.1 YheC/YheD family protein [Heyndrickxia sporothermodurans]MBL5783445.1 YheC/YheD family protein [Heyndrickxia sporothermodurans]